MVEYWLQIDLIVSHRRIEEKKETNLSLFCKHRIFFSLCLFLWNEKMNGKKNNNGPKQANDDDDDDGSVK